MGLLDKFKKGGEPERVSGGELVFCLEGDPDKALSQLEDLFQLPLSGKGNNITLREEDMELVLAAFGTSEEGENGEYAKKQLQGAWNYFRLVKTDHIEVQRGLLYHLRQCRGVLQVRYSFDSTGDRETQEKEREIFTQLAKITDRLQGLSTAGDVGILRDGRGRLVLDMDGKSELDFYLPAEIPVPEDWGASAPPESMDRRNRSMALLRDKRIYATPWLPLLSEQETDQGRTVEEVCGRAAALLAVSLYSECRVGEHMSYEESRRFVAPIIESYGAEEFFSPNEKKYLDDPDSTEQDQIQYAWQYENLWVMEWALGLTDDLFWPDRICDVPGSVRMMREYPDMEKLTAAARLRPRRELLDQADLIYRLHWACVDARVMGMPAPQGVESGVVMERHRALFWLAGCDNLCPWDDVDLST